MSDRLRLLRRLALAALVGLLAAASALAQSGYRQGQAANAAREATGGRVLGVQRADQDGHRGYRVRILQPDGRVRSLHFDPDSGAVRD